MKNKRTLFLLFPILLALSSCEFESIDPSKMDVDVKFTEWDGTKNKSGTISYSKLTNEVYDDIDYATYTSLTFYVNLDEEYESLTGLMFSVYSSIEYDLYFKVYIAPREFNVEKYKLYMFDSSLFEEEVVEPYYTSEEVMSVTTDPKEATIPFFPIEYDFETDKVQIVIEISDNDNFSIVGIDDDENVLFANSYEYVICVDDVYFTTPSK